MICSTITVLSVYLKFALKSSTFINNSGLSSPECDAIYTFHLYKQVSLLMLLFILLALQLLALEEFLSVFDLDQLLCKNTSQFRCFSKQQQRAAFCSSVIFYYIVELHIYGALFKFTCHTLIRLFEAMS